MSSIENISFSELSYSKSVPQGSSASGPAKVQAQDTDHDSDRVRESHSDHEDRFTPSQAASQDAGLFQVSQLNFFSAAAEFFLAQSTAAPNPAVASQPASSATSSTSNTPVKSSSPVASIPSAPPAPLITPQNVSSSGSTSGTSASQGASGLDELNKALSALGLNSDQVNAFDQVAGLIKAFSPDAFKSLVSQLQNLAHANSAAVPSSASASAAGNTSSAAAGAATPASATSGASTPASTATPSPSTASVPASGFQVQELSIKFSGLQETLSQSSAVNGQTSNSSVQLSAFSLQIQEVNLTLANNASGQSIQLTATQPTGSLTTPKGTPVLTASSAPASSSSNSTSV
jgi:trimeric autotransporter adhesin